MARCFIRTILDWGWEVDDPFVYLFLPISASHHNNALSDTCSIYVVSTLVSPRFSVDLTQHVILLDMAQNTVMGDIVVYIDMLYIFADNISCFDVCQFLWAYNGTEL